MSNLQEFCDLSKEYRVLSDYIISIKRNIRIIRFKNLIHSIDECFLKNDAQRGLSELKKISKPSYSPSQSPVYIKDKEGNVIVSQEDQLNRFAEHYEELASDITGHSLNENYWKRILNNSSSPQESWDINQPISMSEIHSTCSFNEK